MMNDYIDLVVCEVEEQIRTGVTTTRTQVCEAPAWSDLDKGDEVIVGVDGTQALAKVERRYTTPIDGPELEFILIASGTKLPLPKVLKKVIYRDFEYVEGEK